MYLVKSLMKKSLNINSDIDNGKVKAIILKKIKDIYLENQRSGEEAEEHFNQINRAWRQILSSTIADATRASLRNSLADKNRSHYSVSHPDIDLGIIKLPALELVSIEKDYSINVVVTKEEESPAVKFQKGIYKIYKLQPVDVEFYRGLLEKKRAKFIEKETKNADSQIARFREQKNSDEEQYWLSKKKSIHRTRTMTHIEKQLLNLATDAPKALFRLESIQTDNAAVEDILMQDKLPDLMDQKYLPHVSYGKGISHLAKALGWGFFGFLCFAGGLAAAGYGQLTTPIGATVIMGALICLGSYAVHKAEQEFGTYKKIQKALPILQPKKLFVEVKQEQKRSKQKRHVTFAPTPEIHPAQLELKEEGRSLTSSVMPACS